MALLVGCGSDAPSPEGDAIDLTRWLPADAKSYRVVDIEAINADFGLPAGTHPVDPMEHTAQNATWQVLSMFMPGQDKTDFVYVGAPYDPGPKLLRPREVPLMEAIDPPALTAGAQAPLEEGAKAPRLAVLRTTADTDAIASALGDIGYSEHDGVLVPPHDSGDAPAIRLENDLIFASTELEALRSVPAEPAEELPLALLSRVEGNEITAGRTDDQPNNCLAEWAWAGDRGEGELAYLVRDGSAEAARFHPDDDPRVDVDVDEDVLIARVQLAEDEIVAAFVADRFAGYDCEDEG